MDEKRNRYPQLEIDLEKLQENLAALQERCQASCIKLTGIVKGFTALPQAAQVYETAGLDSIGSSRLEQLKRLRQFGIRSPLMMIRIPMCSEVDELVEWADISLQSESTVLRATNEAAARAGPSPESEEGKEITALHRRWLTITGNRYDPARHRGIAELYVMDERFTAYYDKRLPGCARFLRDAVVHWAQ